MPRAERLKQSSNALPANEYNDFTSPRTRWKRHRRAAAGGSLEESHIVPTTNNYSFDRHDIQDRIAASPRLIDVPL